MCGNDILEVTEAMEKIPNFANPQDSVVGKSVSVVDIIKSE